ncbi:fructose-bisphosphatase class III, partial [Clostridioides difficile]|uniref:fructose-bisphosphatase class III n=1 Tax=Clostridioides difficile TaxID=1496 RepID=UPI001F3CC757
FKDKAEEKLYGMDIMWYLWTGKCSSLFGKDDMTTFERYFIAEIEKLPPEKQVEVIAAIEGAIEGIDSVDKKTIKDKWGKLKA